MNIFHFIRLLFIMSLTVTWSESLTAAAPLPPRHLEYEIAFSSQSQTPCLNVTLTFSGDAGGTSDIALPSGLSVGAAYPNVSDVRAVSDGTTFEDTIKPQIKRVMYPPGKSVAIAYRVSITKAGQNLELSYSPQIERDHFSILGLQLFAIPSGSADTPVAVEITWNSLPPGWTLADSYGVQQAHQIFAATLDTLLHSVWSAGDYRLLHTLIRGKDFYVAVRGNWPVPDAKMLGTFSRILSAERQFWHDDTSSYYLVVLNPSQDGIVGMGFVNSFYEAVEPARITSFPAEHIFAHEAFHAWLPNRVRVAGADHRYDWLYEGFTDYYARLFQLRTGLISLTEYASDCNRVVREYQSSPFRNSSGLEFRQQAKLGFPDNRSLQLAYERGDLLAQHWNAQIRLATHGQHSLDDVMQALLRLALDAHQPLPVSDFVAAVRHYTHNDVPSEILQFTEQGKMIVPDPAALGPNAHLAPTRVTLFNPGYNLRSSSQSEKITGVEPQSSAYRAGLRDGQDYVDVDMTFGDPAKEMRVTVKDQSSQRVISYYPAGEIVTMPQYKLKSARSDAASLSWLGVVSTH